MSLGQEFEGFVRSSWSSSWSWVRRAVGAAFGIVLNPLAAWRYETFIGVAHLRAKKDGFLTFMAVLSIAGVLVGSCAANSTISIMGGFGADLKRKILANHAHITIDRPGGEIADADRVLREVRGVPGVRAATPSVVGEVMLSSPTNLPSGVLLRGIDPRTIGSVIDLRRNLEVGNVDYLVHPARLLDLPLGDDEEAFGRLLPPPANAAEPPGVKRGASKREGQGAVGSIVTSLRRVGDAGDAGVGPSAPSAAPPVPAPAAREIERPAPREVLPGIIIGRELAKALRLYIGDEVNVISPLGDLGPSGPIPKSRPFRIAGVFYSGMYEYDSKYAYVTIPVAQRFLGIEGVSIIEAKVTNVESADRIARGIRRAVAGRADLRVRDWKTLNRTLFSALKLEKIAVGILFTMVIIIASFCIVVMLLLMVVEKGKEIAVLKSLGATDGGIMRIFVFEGLLIGIFGAISGAVLAFLFCKWLEVFGLRFRPVANFLREIYYTDRLPVHVAPSDLLLVSLAAIVISFLATLYPAYAASRVHPVEGLRYEG